MKRPKITLFIILLFLISTFTISAARIADGYSVVIQKWAGIDHNKRFDETGAVGSKYASMGRFVVEPRDGTPVKSGDLLKIVITSTTDLKLVNIEDHTKIIDTNVKISDEDIKTDIYLTSLPYLHMKTANYSATVLEFNIPTLPPNTSSYYGTYAMPITIDIYDANDNWIATDTYTIITYNNVKSQNPSSSTTHAFFVEEYPASKNIDITYMTQNQYTTLPVGIVTFMATQKYSGSYKIEFKPDSGNKFKFKKDGQGSVQIPHKLTFPGRDNLSYDKTRTITITDKGDGGFHQDVIEVGLTGVNYENDPLIGGNYTSTIIVTLIKD